MIGKCLNDAITLSETLVGLSGQNDDIFAKSKELLEGIVGFLRKLDFIFIGNVFEGSVQQFVFQSGFEECKGSQETHLGQICKHTALLAKKHLKNNGLSLDSKDMDLNLLKDALFI